MFTHSPADSRFCFSSFLMRGRPGFIFRGEVGVFCAAGWMKWANSSVCFNRYSNLLVRSVCYTHRKTTLLIYLSKNKAKSEETSVVKKKKKKKKRHSYHFLLITRNLLFSFGWGGGCILTIRPSIWWWLFSSIWRIWLLLGRKTLTENNLV